MLESPYMKRCRASLSSFDRFWSLSLIMTAATASPPSHSRGWCYLTLALIALTLLFGQFDHDLWSPDEPREAGIAWEMLRQHDYIVPTLAGQYFIEKPPLFYWSATALAHLSAGLISPVAVLRLLCALYGAGTLLCLWAATRRLFGRDAAWFSILSLATMSGFLEHMHVIRTDVSLAFFCSLSLWALVECYYADRRIFSIVSGIALAGTFMTKGIVGLVILIPFWGALFLYQAARLGRTQWGRLIIDNLVMVALATALCGSWCWQLIQHRDGEWLWNEWFWRNQIGRLNGTAGLGHDEATTKFDYLPQLASLTLAWVPFIIGWLVQCAMRFRHLSAADRLLLLGGLASFAILSVASTKRALYLLPILPFFAMMVGQFLAQHREHRAVRLYGQLTLWIAVVVQVLIMASPWLVEWVHTRYATPTLQALVRDNHAGYAVAAAMTVLAMAATRLPHRAPFKVFLSVVCVFVTYTMFMNPILADRKSTAQANTQLYNAIPEEAHHATLGINLSEVQQGALSFYNDWRVRNITPEELSERLQKGLPFGLLVSGQERLEQLRPILAPVMSLQREGYDQRAENDETRLTWVWLTPSSKTP